MLSELGAVGLALLIAVLALPSSGAFVARRSRFVAAGTGAYPRLVGSKCAGLALGDGGGHALGVPPRRRSSARIRSQGVRPRSSGASRWVALGLSICLTAVSIVSLVGNQALFAGREAVARKEWVAAGDHARRARGLLFWSHEPSLVLGDAAAGLGNRASALDAYRDAVAKDSHNWVAWLRLAQVARGAERAMAYERVHELNPLEEDLPGESDQSPG